MTYDVSIRPAQVEDAAGIAVVHGRSRASYYGVPADPAGDERRTKMWATFVGQPDRLTLVAESDRIIGFVSLVHETEPGPRIVLKALYVLPDDFGRGLGRRLQHEFDRQRRPGELGVLEVWAGNDRAIGFYERRGWRRTTTSRPGPQGLDFVTFTLGDGVD